MSRRRAGGAEEEEEPILQWQDGVGNIPIWREEENVPTFNTSYSVDRDDVVWAMSVAMMVVLLVGSLCCLAKCNANMLSNRKRRKMRAEERRKKRKEVREAKAAAIRLENTQEKKKEEDPPKPIVKEGTKAISKSNPQTHRLEKPKPKSRKDFIIDIIDSALGGDSDLVNGLDGLRAASEESIDRSGLEQGPRRGSDASVTLSLVFDIENEKPIFRRL